MILLGLPYTVWSKYIQLTQMYVYNPQPIVGLGDNEHYVENILASIIMCIKFCPKWLEWGLKRSIQHNVDGDTCDIGDDNNDKNDCDDDNDMEYINDSNNENHPKNNRKSEGNKNKKISPPLPGTFPPLPPITLRSESDSIPRQSLGLFLKQV